MTDSTENPLEPTLHDELRRIDAEIDRLQKRAASVRIALRAIKTLKIQGSGPTRKNSANRMLVEGSILGALPPGSAATSGTLLGHAMSISGPIKRSTFRSYLHRLKKRGEIERGLDGRWRRVQR